MANLSVDVPQFVFMVSKTNRESFGDPPEWADFEETNRLELLEIFESTSITGPSYAKVKLIVSSNGNDELGNIPPENGDRILWLGDQVAIGLRRSDGIEWLFGGRCTVAPITIGATEQLVYKISGPEFDWGDAAPGSGALRQITGQFRRTGTGDDVYAKAGGNVITTYDYWDLFTDVDAVFNPDGRSNMTATDVDLTKPPAKKLTGRIWEELDRRINSVEKAELWNVLEAAKVLCAFYNDPEKTGIDVPEKWDGDDFPLKAEDKLAPMRVQGLGLYQALRLVCGTKYAFYVDPTPATVKGNKMTGFKLVFFDRTSGPDANFVLNKQGTTMRNAVASVVNLQAARDVQKSVSEIVARARYVRPVRL